MVGRVGALYYIGVVVVSEAYSWDGEFVEREVAIAARHPAAGNAIEGAEDEAWALGLGVLAVRTIPGYEEWTNWGPNASCRNPTRDGFM